MHSACYSSRQAQGLTRGEQARALTCLLVHLLSPTCLLRCTACKVGVRQSCRAKQTTNCKGKVSLHYSLQAMNRSLANVILGGYGTNGSSGPKKASGGAGGKKKKKFVAPQHQEIDVPGAFLLCEKALSL